MRILVTNDDGIAAPGLAVLEKVARSISDEVWVVAPETDQSGLSHSLTLGDPLRLRDLGNRRFALRGTPSDCVIMATRRIMPEVPELVLSGINAGQNTADDVTYSGTVAGAIEGTLIGIPSIALSLAVDPDNGGELHWETAERFAPEAIGRLLEFGFRDGLLYNVNFPDAAPGDVAGMNVTRQGRLIHSLYIDERTDPRGNKYYWLGYRRRANEPVPGTDMVALDTRHISVTPLRIDLTDHDRIDSLRQHFSSELEKAEG